MTKSKKEKKDKKKKKSSKHRKSIKKEKLESTKSSETSDHENKIKEETVIKDDLDPNKVIVKFKSSKRKPYIMQGKQRIYPLIECYDDDDVIEFDATKVT